MGKQAREIRVTSSEKPFHEMNLARVVFLERTLCVRRDNAWRKEVVLKKTKNTTDLLEKTEKWPR